MQKQISLILILCFTLSFSLQAQKFLRPFESISGKKTTYIMMEDGKEIEGTVKKIKRKKGLIKLIEIKVDGKKKEIAIEDIKHAYLPQSGWDKFMKFDDFLVDATQWEDGLYDQERLKEGYAFFEKAEVMVKKKKMTLLMQLLNPGPSSRIKVYHNPFSGETASFRPAGIKVVGGDDKSYYMSLDNKPAIKIHKKQYNKKKIAELFGKCKGMSEKSRKTHWENFSKAVYELNTKCSK